MTGPQVTELREALRLSPSEMARALGTGPLTFSNWEKSGPHNLGLEVLWGLHRAVFGVDDQGAAREARIERISGQLRLGIGALLYFGMLSRVAAVDQGGSR